MLEFLKDHGGWLITYIVTIVTVLAYAIRNLDRVKELTDKVNYLEKDGAIMRTQLQEHTYKLGTHSEKIIDLERSAERLVEATNRLTTSIEVFSSMINNIKHIRHNEG